ncbi:MAG: ABC transporter permease [Fimbriimonadaceae bacterium]|nr:hypothetical protein [Fimbriimonadaceae bacterium]MCL4285090.1 ABC transporter permease [Fimbriimonadaceae bacterium]QOJ10530.1 MAG: ABC transporter permease [Chthonomonadaceae bacterium]
MESWVGTLLVGALIYGAPLVLATMGGYCSERGGVINIGLEGKMLIAAAVTALVGAGTENSYFGLCAGIGSAVLLSWFHWLLTQTYQIDHIVSGMAINAIAIGSSNFLDKQFTDPDRAHGIPTLPLNAYYVAALLAPLALAWFTHRTRGGLRLLAVGSDPSKSRQMGVKPLFVRFYGLTVTGVLCGLSGALIFSNSKWFTDGMTAGRGFIALAALILGGWRPIPAAIACLVFGFFDSMQIIFQGTRIGGVVVPSEFWSSLPYVITVVALAGFLGKSRVPSGLGKP